MILEEGDILDKPGKGDKLYKQISQQGDRIREESKRIKMKPSYIGLCFSCQHAFIFRYAHKNDPVIKCGQDFVTGGADLRGLDVAECNKYTKHGELDLWDMVKSTKIVDLSIATKKVGFEK